MRFTTLLPLLIVAASNCLTGQNVTQVSRGDAVEMNLGALGVNSGIQRFTDDKDFWKAVRLTGATAVRYPSGTPSSLFNWETLELFDEATIIERLNDNPVWMPWNLEIGERLKNDPRKEEKYSMQTYAEYGEFVGADVSWILNLGTDTQEHLMEQIDVMAAADFPVKYIELGNELNGAAFVGRFPTVESYMDFAKPIIAHIRKKIPDARIGMPTDLSTLTTSQDANNMASTQDRHHHWATVSMQNDLGLDLVQHNYLGPTSQGDIAREIFLAEEYELQEFYVQSPFFLLQDWTENLRLNGRPETKIWLTEYNLWTLAPDVMRFKDSPLYALYFANWWLLLLADERIEMAHYHNHEGELFGLFTVNSGWMGRGGKGYGPDEEDFDDVTFYPQAQYLSQISESARMANTMHRVNFVNQPVRDGIVYWRGRKCPSFNGLMFVGDEEAHLIVLNLTPDPQIIDSGMLLTADSGYSLNGGDNPMQPIRKNIIARKTRFPLKQPVDQQNFALPSQRLTLPAFSFNKFVWKNN